MIFYVKTLFLCALSSQSMTLRRLWVKSDSTQTRWSASVGRRTCVHFWEMTSSLWTGWLHCSVLWLLLLLPLVTG